MLQSMGLPRVRHNLAAEQQQKEPSRDKVPVSDDNLSFWLSEGSQFPSVTEFPIKRLKQQKRLKEKTISHLQQIHLTCPYM